MGDPGRLTGTARASSSFISWLRDTGQWKPDNSRIAIISGSKPYSIVIAKRDGQRCRAVRLDGPFGPEIVNTPTTRGAR